MLLEPKKNQEQVKPMSSSEIMCSASEASKVIPTETRKNQNQKIPVIPAKSIYADSQASEFVQ